MEKMLYWPKPHLLYSIWWARPVVSEIWLIWYQIYPPKVVASSGKEQYYMITTLHSVIWCLPTAEVSQSYITMQKIWVLENEAIYVNLNFCFCCCAYCFMLFLLFCVHNYTWTTTRTTKWYSNNKKNENKKIHVNWSFCSDATCCSCSYCCVILLFICNCECTMRNEQQQNDTVTMTLICKRWMHKHLLRCTPHRGIWWPRGVLHKVILTFWRMQLRMHWIHSLFKISDEMYPPSRGIWWQRAVQEGPA